MDIGEPLRELGTVDVTALVEATLALPQPAWEQDQRRQQDYDVHRSTESVVLIFTDGSGWPDITVTRESGWDLLAKQAVPVMEGIIRDHYAPGGTIVRAMAAKLLPGELITPHRDSHPSFHHGHRIHIPIKTNPRVRFMIEGRPYKMQVGQAYEINNQKTHSVMNKGSEFRINFIFDYMPPELIDGSNRKARADEIA
ncbi:MAG: aspartyl/asparaginyl beta-hydroxylase domain-containing protein [Halioglobus sp.]